MNPIPHTPATAQDMSAFQWVMAWAEVLPPQHMATLLDMGFFPKWHQVGHGYWLLVCSKPCDHCNQLRHGSQSCLDAVGCTHGLLELHHNRAFARLTSAFSLQPAISAHILNGPLALLPVPRCCTTGCLTPPTMTRSRAGTWAGRQLSPPTYWTRCECDGVGVQFGCAGRNI